MNDNATATSIFEESKDKLCREIFDRAKRRGKEEGGVNRITYSEILELKDKAGLVITDEQLEKFRIAEESPVLPKPESSVAIKQGREFKVGDKVMLINQFATGRPNVRYNTIVNSIVEITQTDLKQPGTVMIENSSPNILNKFDLVLLEDIVTEEEFTSPLYGAFK